MVKSLISIVMPTKGRVDFVRRAVQSVLDQSFQDYELLVLDDSPDNLREELRAITRGYPRIRFIERKGTSPDERRRIGVEASQGDYVTFLDSDDTWRAERLERHLSVWKHNRIGLSWDRWVEILDGHPRTFPQPLSQGPIPAPLVAKLLYRRNFIHCSAGFTKKRLIQDLGGYPTWNLNSDWVLYMKLAQRYPCFGIDETLTFKNLDAPERLGNSERDLSERDRCLVKREALIARPSVYWDGFLTDLIDPLSYGRKGGVLRPAVDILKRRLDPRSRVPKFDTLAR